MRSERVAFGPQTKARIALGHPAGVPFEPVSKGQLRQAIEIALVS